jgi:CRP/FNR family transcriptional regulator
MDELLKCGAVIPDTFFPVEKLENYIHFGTAKSYGRGSAVVMPGEDIQTIIYVISGKLRVNMLIDDGRERLIFFAGKHGILGRLFPTCNEIYTVALEDSKVCIFSIQQLKQIFRIDDELIFDILRNYLSKVSYYMKQTAEMDYFYPTVRVVRLLHQLCISRGISVGNSYEVSIDLSLKSISEITGAHYVTVSKVIGCLKKQNILDKKKDKIIIHNLERLKELTLETHIFKNSETTNMNTGFTLLAGFLACSKEILPYLG